MNPPASTWAESEHGRMVVRALDTQIIPLLQHYGRRLPRPGHLVFGLHAVMAKLLANAGHEPSRKFLARHSRITLTVPVIDFLREATPVVQRLVQLWVGELPQLAEIKVDDLAETFYHWRIKTNTHLAVEGLEYVDRMVRHLRGGGARGEDEVRPPTLKGVK